MRISICIPVYEMYGHGVEYLSHLINTIKSQTYKDFEIIISDHSVDNEIEKFTSTINAIYFRNERGRGNSSINMNEAIKLAKGEIIKIMHQDDYFYSNEALQMISDSLLNSKWGAAGFIHNYDGSLIKTMNHIVGCPSTSFFINDNNFFDENLIFINDHDLHTRLGKKYGEPIYIPETLIVIRQHENTVSNKIITNGLANDEWKYFKEKN